MKNSDMPADKILKGFIHEHPDWPIQGVKYFDINPLYKDSYARELLVTECLRSLENRAGLFGGFDHIAIVESRGFIIGSILADRLEKGLVLVRNKPGRLPGEFCFREHLLEYGNGRVEVQKGSGRVLVFDDVIATGGTANAAIAALTEAGYEVVGASFPVELTYCKPQLDCDYVSAVKYDKK